MKPETVTLRALNYLRGTHLPTYVALRMMLATTADALLPAVVSDAVSQTTIRKTARILELRRFKPSVAGAVSYRRYFVPSPTGALADAYALGRLHGSGALKRSADVYSYRPPASESYGRNYEHFASGYAERNGAIAESLRVPMSSAVVLDLTNFYPSVPGGVALTALLARCREVASLDARDLQIIEAAGARAIAPDGGLLVGLEMSHALASVYLEGVDRDLREQFPGKYFRYVDDIVVVTDNSRIDETVNRVDAVLERYGLRRNREKDAVAGRLEWEGFRSTRGASGQGQGQPSVDCLTALKFRLKLFLSRHPQALASLQAELNSRGIFLPVEQLADGSRDRDWRERVIAFFNDNWDVVLRHRFDRISDVVAAAIDCRELVVRSLDVVLENFVEAASGTVARRWQIQRARYAINRALYFVDDNKLRAIASFAERIPELAEARAVCEALLGNLAPLAFTPGPAVAAATQLLSLRRAEPTGEVFAISRLTDFYVTADLGKV